jgi:hypothetical protein
MLQRFWTIAIAIAASLAVPALSWLVARPYLPASELRALIILLGASLLPATVGALWARHRLLRAAAGDESREAGNTLHPSPADAVGTRLEAGGADNARVRRWVALNRDFQLALDAYQTLEERLSEIETQVGSLSSQIKAQLNGVAGVSGDASGAGATRVDSKVGDRGGGGFAVPRSLDRDLTTNSGMRPRTPDALSPATWPWDAQQPTEPRPEGAHFPCR